MNPITVIYEIKDQSAFRACNPLDYEHNGVKSFCVAWGNVIEKGDALVLALKRIQDEGCFVSRELATAALANYEKP